MAFRLITRDLYLDLHILMHFPIWSPPIERGLRRNEFKYVFYKEKISRSIRIEKENGRWSIPAISLNFDLPTNNQNYTIEDIFIWINRQIGLGYNLLEKWQEKLCKNILTGLLFGVPYGVRLQSDFNIILDPFQYSCTCLNLIISIIYVS